MSLTPAATAVSHTSITALAPVAKVTKLVKSVGATATAALNAHITLVNTKPKLVSVTFSVAALIMSVKFNANASKLASLSMLGDTV